MRWIVGFGRFWYDFIVGDSVVLAIGGVLSLLLAAVLVAVGANGLAEVALPLVVLATLILSLVWPS